MKIFDSEGMSILPYYKLSYKYYSDLTVNVTSDVFYIMLFEGHSKNTGTKHQNFTQNSLLQLESLVLCFDQLFRQMTVAALLQY